MNKKTIIAGAAVLFTLTALLLIPYGKATAQTYWDAIFELGYDEVNQRQNAAAACQRLEKIFHLNTLVSDHLRIDKKLRLSMQNLPAGIQSGDVKYLYSDLSDLVAGSLWQGLEVRGRSNHNYYQLYLTRPAIENGLNPALRPYPGISYHQNHFGDLNLRVLIRPTQADTFRFITRGQLYLDDLPMQNLARVLNGMLKTLWQQASHRIVPPMDFLQNAHLNYQSRKLLYGMATDFPHLFKLVRRYVIIENLVSANLAHVDDTITVGLQGQFNRTAFVTDYPEIAKLLYKIEGMVLLRTQILDELGRQMGSFELDSERNCVKIKFRTFDGRLLPLHDNRHPEVPGGFSLIEEGRSRFQVVSDIHMRLLGLHFDIKGLQAVLEYTNSGNRLYLKASLKQPPQTIAVSGRMFGVLPVWLVDLFIPSNVENITTRFFDTLARSNRGQGAEFELASLPQRAKKNSLWLHSDAEVVSNGTLKLGLNFQRAIAVDRHKLFTQIRALRKQLWYAFYRDYKVQVSRLRQPLEATDRRAVLSSSAL